MHASVDPPVAAGLKLSEFPQTVIFSTTPILPPPRAHAQGLGPDAVDEVEIDFSPLRVAREITDPLGERADSIAAELEGKLMVEDGADNMAIASPVEDVSTGEQRVVREEGEEGDGDDENDDGEDEEDEWLGDPNKRPIWKFPVVSRVSWGSHVM